jgi:hypothetical protein
MDFPGDAKYGGRAFLFDHLQQSREITSPVTRQRAVDVRLYVLLQRSRDGLPGARIDFSGDWGDYVRHTCC